jgi:hypothetical protein
VKCELGVKITSFDYVNFPPAVNLSGTSMLAPLSHNHSYDREVGAVSLQNKREPVVFLNETLLTS